MIYKAFLIMVIMSFSYLSQSLAQAVVENTAQYQNSTDEMLTLKRITFIPSTDNVNGIYAKDINTLIKSFIAKNHQWNFVEMEMLGSHLNLEDFIDNPQKVKTFSQNISADAFFAASFRKDAEGSKLHLYLFSIKNGQLLAEENFDLRKDNTKIVKTTTLSMLRKIMSKIPYDGLILSRIDNRVTVNLGKDDGIMKGQSLNAVKIIGLKKHPKRGFILKTNKAIVGQLRIVKVDKYLSFADILTESEAGVVQTDTKVIGVQRVQYKETPWTKTYTPPEQLLSENNKTVFGKNAEEWVAKDPPTFGRIGASLALGSFNNSLGFSDGTNIGTKVSTYPRIDIHGEVWIDPKVYANFSFAQGIAESDNPTGSPAKISNSLTQYRLSFGYNFILRNEFFGPKLSLDFGLSGYDMFIDGTSSTGFSSLEYRSFPIGIGGYVPINKSRSWAIGGKAYFHLFPSLNEQPFSSGGDPNNNINQFIFYAENRLSQRLRLKFGLEFFLLSSSFSGAGSRPTPADNLSHRFTMLNTSIDYLF